MSYAVGESQQHVKIAVLGAGNMGTVMAHALAQNGHDVTIWDHFPDVVEDIRRHRTNRRFLPGVELHTGMIPFASAGECIAGASFGVLSSYADSIGSHVGERRYFTQCRKGVCTRRP